MEHLLLKAATTAATDEGTFEAVISTASLDRDGDIVEPLAMVNALAKWAALGKLVPLAWNHTDEVIGHIDPMSVRVEDKEVIAKGWIDQGIDRGQEAWRLVKSGTFSFSFGYLIPKGGADKLANGRFRIKELDIFEISGVPIAPANNDTRVLSWKSVKRLVSDVREQLDASGAERYGTENKNSWVYVDDFDPDQKWAIFHIDGEAQTRKFVKVAYTIDAQGSVSLEDGEVEVVRTTSYREKSADVTDEDAKRRSVDPLRKQAESVALEFASGGLSLQKPPRQVVSPKPEPELSLRELKQRTRDEILTHLSGGTTP